MDFNNNLFISGKSMVAYCKCLSPAFSDHTTLKSWNSQPLESLNIGQMVQRCFKKAYSTALMFVSQ
jgi:hypothetical protein